MILAFVIVMKHYLEIAKQYFLHLEGVHLYPSFRTLWFWAWMFSTSLWLWTIAHYADANLKLHVAGGLPSVLLPEVLWLFVSMQISTKKNQKLVDMTNLRLGTSFTTPSECRRYILVSVMAVQPREFLKAAQEIDGLIAFQRKYLKRSALTAEEFMRNIYDRDSKARLMTLIIALVSMTVVLSARSDATLETVFDVYSDSGNRGFLALIAFVVTAMFFIFIGLRIFVMTIVEGLASWSIKLFGSDVFSGWLLSYLIRDLITYHSRVVIIPQLTDPYCADVDLAGSPQAILPLHSRSRNSEDARH